MKFGSFGFSVGEFFRDSPSPLVGEGWGEGTKKFLVGLIICVGVTVSAADRDPVVMAVALEELAPMAPKEERARDKMIGSFSAVIQRLAVEAQSKDDFLNRVIKRYENRPKEETLNTPIPHLVMFWHPEREGVKGVHMYRATRRTGFPATLGELTEETYGHYVADILSHFTEEAVSARRKPGVMIAQGKVTLQQMESMWRRWDAAHPRPSEAEGVKMLVERGQKAQQWMEQSLTLEAENNPWEGVGQDLKGPATQRRLPPETLKKMKESSALRLMIFETADRVSCLEALNKKNWLQQPILVMPEAVWTPEMSGITQEAFEKSLPGEFLFSQKGAVLKGTQLPAQWMGKTYGEWGPKMTDGEYGTYRASMIQAALSEGRLAQFRKEVFQDKQADKYLPTSTWLGVFTEETPEGLRVIYVEAYSPASKAGIQKGDVLTQWGEKPIQKKSQLQGMVANTFAGTTVALKVKREKDVLTLNVVIQSF